MMKNWLIGSAAIFLAAHQAQAQTAAVPACPALATQDVAWTGMRLLQGGKGYVQTPMGQVHYRMTGPVGGPVVLLLHQSPWSMIEYGEIQACLAEKGVRSLAVDTPGYGMSDAPQGVPTIAQYADNLLPVLDALKLRRVVVAGHHTGSTIAAAFVARHPDRTLGLILHGTPLFSPDERSTAPTGSPQDFVLKDDGSHLSDYFKVAHDYAGPNPRTRVTATWSVIDRYRAGVNDVARDLVAHYDMAADLAKIRAPVLILSDAKDFLHEKDLRAIRLFPRFHYLQFSNDGAHALMIDPAHWAAVVTDFVAQVAKAPQP
jgi:pimeloyl-ACP methyl ester carboxylesterase